MGHFDFFAESHTALQHFIQLGFVHTSRRLSAIFDGLVNGAF
jgi:hypothetical protein